MSRRYWKVTNEQEYHEDFQYHDGLNIYTGPFRVDERYMDGLMFTSDETLDWYYGHGIYLREVILPKENPDFKMVRVIDFEWRANMIILGKRYPLYQLDTYQKLDIKMVTFEQAVATGSMEMVKFVLENQSVDRLNYDYLCTAASCGHLKILRFLVDDAQIDLFPNVLEKMSSEEYQRLTNAKFCMEPWKSSSREEILERIRPDVGARLVPYLPSVDGISTFYPWSIFNYTAWPKNRLEIFKFLLDHLKDDDTIDYKSIYLAAEEGGLEVVQLLLKNPRFHPYHAINIASKKGHTEIVKLLLKDPRVNPSKEEHILSWMSREGFSEIVDSFRQKYKFMFRDLSFYDDLAIRAAAENGHPEVVKVLLADDRVNPSVKNNLPLKLALRNGHLEIVKLLLNNTLTTSKFNGKVEKCDAIGWKLAHGYIWISGILLDSMKSTILLASINQKKDPESINDFQKLKLHLNFKEINISGVVYSMILLED